eukprot:TRINITY_DN566_c0_g1_i1.p1 TRINITY_DN566_c0_g1~~TRINITY_DN566_c0_g1_i1.p1  ORF type:complete len:568 (+),score=92.88 TRINITY_DN566_c0_g1_i1:125-1705(+)
MDHSCLFHCFAHAVQTGFSQEVTVAELREICAKDALDASDQDAKAVACEKRSTSDYAASIRQCSTWGGEHEIITLSQHYGFEVSVVSALSLSILNYGTSSARLGTRVYFLYTGKHYDMILAESSTAGLCTCHVPAHDPLVPSLESSMMLLALDHIESEGPTLDMKRDCRILGDHIQRISQEMGAVDGAVAVEVPRGGKKSGSPPWTALVGQLRRLLETNHKNITERCLKTRSQMQEKQVLAVEDTISDEVQTNLTDHQHEKEDTQPFAADDAGSHDERMELANQDCAEKELSIPDEAAEGRCEMVEQEVHAFPADGTAEQEREAAPKTNCAHDSELKEKDALVEAVETIDVAGNNELQERGAEELEPKGAMDKQLEVLEKPPAYPEETSNGQRGAVVEEKKLCVLRPAACVVNNQATCTSRRAACSTYAKVSGTTLKSCKSASNKGMTTPLDAKLCQQKPVAKRSKNAAKKRGAGTLNQCAITQRPAMSSSWIPGMSNRALSWKCVAAGAACIAVSVIACSLNYLI